MAAWMECLSSFPRDLLFPGQLRTSSASRRQQLEADAALFARVCPRSFRCARTRVSSALGRLLSLRRRRPKNRPAGRLPHSNPRASAASARPRAPELARCTCRFPPSLFPTQPTRPVFPPSCPSPPGPFSSSFFPPPISHRSAPTPTRDPSIANRYWCIVASPSHLHESRCTRESRCRTPASSRTPAVAVALPHACLAVQPRSSAFAGRHSQPPIAYASWASDA